MFGWTSSCLQQLEHVLLFGVQIREKAWASVRFTFVGLLPTLGFQVLSTWSFQSVSVHLERCWDLRVRRPWRSDDLCQGLACRHVRDPTELGKAGHERHDNIVVTFRLLATAHLLARNDRVLLSCNRFPSCTPKGRCTGNTPRCFRHCLRGLGDEVDQAPKPGLRFQASRHHLPRPRGVRPGCRQNELENSAGASVGECS